jgi:hypothetical protein
VGVISEVLSLWDAISSVSLQPGVEDSMPKRFSGSLVMVIIQLNRLMTHFRR